jgi:hypothetical protein
VIMSSREGSMAISAPRVAYIVDTRGPNILVDSSAIDVAASISSAFCGIIEPLVARIVSSDLGFLIN